MATSGTPAQVISALIASHGVVVFSKTTCGYCSRVKSLLSSLTAKFHVLELDTLPNTSAFQDEFARMTGARSVPRLFVGGKFIGGCDDTVALHSQGKLVPLLTQAGAL